MTYLIITDIFIVLLSILISKFAHKMSRSEIHTKMIQLLPATLFFIVTYVVFAPSSLFLQNISEISLTYIKILPVIGCIAFVVSINIFSIILCIATDKTLYIFNSLIFAVTFGLYIQGNFLNPSFSELNGVEIDWSLYFRQGIISNLFWIIVILVILVLSLCWKTKSQQVIKYMSYFF